MGKALQIRQKAADSPQGLTARRWPALLALARKAAGPYGEDVAAWLAVPEAQAEPCLLELAQCLSRLTMRNVDDLAPLTLDSLRPLCDLTRHCEDALGSWQAEDAAAGLQALAALLDTLEATLTQSAIRPPLTTPVARIATVDVTWNSGLLEKSWPGLSLLAFGHAGVGGAGVRDLLDRLERGMAEDRWPEQQAPFKQALADALVQRSSLDAALHANDPRAAHRASESLEDALTEMEDSLLSAGSGPKRKKPSFFRRLFGLR